jgi:hypothetical protein
MQENCSTPPFSKPQNKSFQSKDLMDLAMDIATSKPFNYNYFWFCPFHVFNRANDVASRMYVDAQNASSFE